MSSELSAREARLRALASLVMRDGASLVSAVEGASMRPTLLAGHEILIASETRWGAGDVVEDEKVLLMVFDPNEEVITRWMP